MSSNGSKQIVHNSTTVLLQALADPFGVNGSGVFGGESGGNDEGELEPELRTTFNRDSDNRRVVLLLRFPGDAKLCCKLGMLRWVVSLGSEPVVLDIRDCIDCIDCIASTP